MDMNMDVRKKEKWKYRKWLMSGSCPQERL